MCKKKFIIFSLFPIFEFFCEEISLQKNFYEKIYNIFEFEHERIMSDKDFINLNIFEADTDYIPLCNILSENFSQTESYYLGFLLNNPTTNLKILKYRQNIIKELSSISIFDSIISEKNFFNKDLVFLKFILVDQEYKDLINEEIDEILLPIQTFLRIVTDFYEYLQKEESLFEMIEKDIENIKILGNKKVKGKILKKIIRNIQNIKIQSANFRFKRSKKIKILQSINKYKSLLFKAFYEFIQLDVFYKIAHMKNSYCFTHFIDKTTDVTPSIKVKQLQNLYNSKKVDTDFDIILNRKGKNVVMQIKNIFKYNMTKKCLFLNIFLSQVLGIAFANEFSMTIFDLIDTQLITKV